APHRGQAYARLREAGTRQRLPQWAQAICPPGASRRPSLPGAGSIADLSLKPKRTSSLPAAERTRIPLPIGSAPMGCPPPVGSPLRPRVAAAEYLSQPLLVHVGVELGGGDAGVAQHLLDGAQIGPAAQQVGGKGVAQHVRGHILADAGLAGVMLET